MSTISASPATATGKQRSARAAAPPPPSSSPSSCRPKRRRPTAPAAPAVINTDTDHFKPVKRRKHTNTTNTLPPAKCNSEPIEDLVVFSTTVPRDTRAPSSSHCLPPAKQDASSMSTSNLEPLSKPNDSESELRAEVARLQAQVQQERTLKENELMRSKQDMLLQFIMEQEKRNKLELENDRQKRHISKLVEHYEQKTSTLQNERTSERARLATAVSEASTFREQVEYLQNIVTTKEDDIDELRRIENEEAAKRDHDSRGLPPAYGSLEDEARMPPYSQHSDGGLVDVAEFKRAIRRTFEQQATIAMAKAAKMRLDTTQKAYASAEVFKLLSRTIHDCCSRLFDILDRAGEITVQHQHTRKKATKDQNNHKNGELHAKDHQSKTWSNIIVRESGHKNFVSERVARLIIDLCWRLLSAHDLRPAEVLLSPGQEARASLHHAHIDDILYIALTAAFASKRPISDLQCYLTQIAALRTRFFSLRLNPTCDYFARSSEWLSSQVEKERELAANTISTEPAVVEQDLAEAREEVSMAEARAEAQEILSNHQHLGNERIGLQREQAE